MLKPIHPRKTRPSEDRIAEQFDRISTFFDDLPIAANSNLSQSISVSPARRESALDIGCGTGKAVVRLSQDFDMVHGIDISEGMLQIARKRCIRHKLANVALHRMSASTIRFDDRSFDFALCTNTLHHIQTPAIVLMEINRVLRPGGRLVMTDILDEGLTGHSPATSTRVLSLLAFAAHLACFSVPKAIQCMRAGMKRPWIEHQRTEVFLNKGDFLDEARRIFSNPTVRTFSVEMGFTHQVELIWDKPE